MNTLPDILFRQAEVRPDKEAVRDPAGAVTYAQLTEDVCTLAQGLAAGGISPGSRVLIALPNGIDFVRCHFGVLAARAISVPCEPNVSLAEFTKIAENSQAEALIASADTIRRLEPALTGTSVTRTFATGKVAELPGQGIVGHGVNHRTLAEAYGMGNSRRLEAARPEDLACIMYTTGSTGMPKGVCLKHSNVLAAIDQIQKFIGYTEADREVVVLPISHSFGLGHVYCNLNAGGSVYLDTGLLRVQRVLQAIENLQATGFPGTPLGYSLLLDNYGTVLPEKLRSLRFAVIDSAPLPPARTSQLHELLPWLNIMVYYGLTEASRSTFISLTGSGSRYWTSVGRATANTNIRIVSEQGLEQPCRQEGEVCISGATVSPGYWNDAEETAKRFRSGWLHTGDCGYLDEDGHLFLTGRLGDTINVGGLKVSPADVEEVLRAFPGIADAAVVGITDSRTGSESVIGVVVPGDPAAFRTGECERFCLERLETYKAPSRIVTVDHIPRSNTGKLLRPALREQVASILNAKATGEQDA
jgi:long-chain acyl-CoA synthetase